MNVTEAIFARRAHRAFAPRLVDEQTLRGLLRAAVQAPSAVNSQPWGFAIVQNAKQLERWSELAKQMVMERAEAKARFGELLRAPRFNIFYDATTLVVIGVDAPTEFSAADCWLAAENLMLAATEAGLGTCCIGFAVPVLNTADAKRELGFAPSAKIFAPVIVGYPSLQPEPVPRREPRIVSWRH